MIEAIALTLCRSRHESDQACETCLETAIKIALAVGEAIESFESESGGKGEACH